MRFEGLVMEPQRLLALDVALRATRARCWTAHKISINNWGQCKILMIVRFGVVAESIIEHYSRLTDPREHILICGYVWNELPREVWTHMFVHTLDAIPRNWYVQLELHRETISWEGLTSNFIHTFSTYEDDLMVDIALQLAKEKIFYGFEESEGSLPDWT